MRIERQTPRRYSVEERLQQFGAAAAQRLRAGWDATGTAFPPQRTALVAFKHKRVIELHAGSDAAWRFVRRYAILGASGGPGPKLREGDRQVPEGLYRVTLLNPNSRFHVSLRLDYPNAFDLQMAREEGRTDLGGDIMIHGGSNSVGCLAVGDAAAEELFALAAWVKPQNLSVIIAPNDLRHCEPPAGAGFPSWAPQLYAQIAHALAQFPRAAW